MSQEASGRGQEAGSRSQEPGGRRRKAGGVIFVVGVLRSVEDVGTVEAVEDCTSGWEAGSLSVGRIQQQTLEQRWGNMALTGHVAQPRRACETLLHWPAAGRLLKKCAVLIVQYTVCSIRCAVNSVQPTVCSVHFFPC